MSNHRKTHSWIQLLLLNPKIIRWLALKQVLKVQTSYAFDTSNTTFLPKRTQFLRHKPFQWDCWNILCEPPGQETPEMAQWDKKNQAKLKKKNNFF